MRIVTVVNRSSKVLECIWDGRHYDLAPGKHAFPEIQAMKFKEQHPVMGTEDPYNLRMSYLIGIEELGDDCSPIEQSESVTKAPLEAGQTVIKGKGGLYAEERLTGLPLDASFTTP